VAAVIPAIDRLTDSLNNTNDRAYHPSIIAAMKLARKKMDRYYSLTDTSSTYRIAMILHPGMKTEYFKQQEWPDAWIATAEALVRDEYTSVYKKQPNVADMPPGNPAAQANSFASFSNLSIKQPTGANSELDDYLRQPIENVPEPLKWWMNHAHIYPTLAPMALDYLSIPGVLPFVLVVLYS
jgi:hypothetical protein